jgi:hypothetical protein
MLQGAIRYPDRTALASRRSPYRADSDREANRGQMRTATGAPAGVPRIPDPVAEPLRDETPVPATHQP